MLERQTKIINGVQGGTRTPTNGFGDRRAAITLPRPNKTKPTVMCLRSAHLLRLSNGAQIPWYMFISSHGVSPASLTGATVVQGGGIPSQLGWWRAYFLSPALFCLCWYPWRELNPHEPIICCLRDINPPFYH